MAYLVNSIQWEYHYKNLWSNQVIIPTTSHARNDDQDITCIMFDLSPDQFVVYKIILLLNHASYSRMFTVYITPTFLIICLSGLPNPDRKS
jgi:hypothetical protein